ncbi:nuclear pore complex protein Nup154-like [Teleopsis dalmanni]|uniref:nuclear pore complex protein Nup154-like n=1 Tax=Teleopsis dalmanni TaxID=139649 RepID=UPI0018CDCD45|nr:nuclear pore complex protein Nup154-like [Teleopsis dalmanni]
MKRFDFRIYMFVSARFFDGVIDLSFTCATKCDPEEYGIHFYKNDEPADDNEGYTYFAKRINCYKEVREMLEKLYEDQGGTFKGIEEKEDGTLITDEISKIVNQSIHIKDPLLHITIYEWLMSHDLTSVLLSLMEPSLGDYLRRNVLRFPDNYKVIDLLWKYYEKNKHHAQAAKILDNLASMETDAIPLDKRIEYLARAVMCMRNDTIGYSMQNGLLLKDVEDRMDIARVQKFILNSISAITPQTTVTDRAIQDLNNKLFDITDLYQQFAEPFELWECKLTILNCSHHNDTLLIESVWQKIISNTIQGCSTSTERVTRLFTKIETLVKEFSQSGNCFPLAFIIHELEKTACVYNMPEAIVPEKLLAMDIDIEIMLEYYYRMIIMNERTWTQEGNEWHLVESCILLTRTLADTVETLWCRSKRRIIGKALDIISSCLNLCYQKPSTESMQQALKQIQCRLQRSL